MLRSIIECRNRLHNIEMKLELLVLEKKQVQETLDMLTQLEAKKPVSSKGEGNQPSQLRLQILKLVQDNPGLNAREIWRLYGDEAIPVQKISSILNNIATAEEIENRGSSGIHGSWYARDKRESSAKAQEIEKAIADHPGITTKELNRMFKDAATSQHIARTIKYLRVDKKVIQNRGGTRSREARWYHV